MKYRRGITVLSLLLLIIAIIIAAVFLVRYLRSRPAVSSGSSHVIPSPPRDGRIEILRVACPERQRRAQDDISRLIS